jgi:hypothetical protein
MSKRVGERPALSESRRDRRPPEASLARAIEGMNWIDRLTVEADVAAIATELSQAFAPMVVGLVVVQPTPAILDRATDACVYLLKLLGLRHPTVCKQSSLPNPRAGFGPIALDCDSYGLGGPRRGRPLRFDRLFIGR